MARGRIISPDFWQDGNIVQLTMAARLFYIGTWNYAYCDKGHLPDDPVGLKLRILPADQVDPFELLAELMDAGRIIRAAVEGKPFLQIPTFNAHQSKDDARWNTKCPICKALETTDEHGRGLPSTSVVSVERSGYGVDRSGVPSPYCPKHPQGTDDPCRACGRARVARADYDKAQKNKPTPGPPSKKDLCPDHPDLGYRRTQCPMH